MWTNYLKVSVRNLLKSKAFSFINVFGLAASMSVCLLVIMLIKDAYRFDKFHPESERTYRILTDALRKGGGEESYATSPFPAGKTLTEAYSYVEKWTPLVRRMSGEYQVSGNLFQLEGLLTDSTFFETFGFRLAAGDPHTVLSEPNTIVLTDAAARRMFTGQNPVGKTISHPYWGDVKITGVLEPFPGKTHLEFDMLSSLATLSVIERDPEEEGISANWNNYYATFNFVRLRPGATREMAETALAQIGKDGYAGLELESRDAGYRFRLQALDEITPGPGLSNGTNKGLPDVLLWFFSALAGILILSACFNYTNLTVARSLTRAREVGVRKVMGATRWQVFAQFISEALLTALVALFLGFGLLQLLIPAFSQMPFLESADITLTLDGPTALWFAGFAVFTGLVAGLLPALMLSKFSPLSVLQRLQNTRLFRRIGLRKALIVTQFAVALIFVIVLTVGWRQVNYAVAENFGFHQSTMLNLQLQGQEPGPLLAELRQIPQVEKTSAVSHLMGTWEDSKCDVRVKPDAEPFGVRDYFVDHSYVDNMDLPLIAGENFPDNPTQQREMFVLVNEKFLEHFQLGEPADVLGKSIRIGDSTEVAIRGVLKDFLFKPLNYAIEPLMLRYDPEQWSVLNLKLRGDDMPAALASVERAWKKVDKTHPVQYTFYDEAVRENFADLYDIIRIVGFLGAMGLLIACLGLLGMAIYSVETKAKEISVRKVIGASTRDLVQLLSKGYMGLLLIAAAVALPASYLLGDQMLQIFAYRIPLDWMVFLPGLVLFFTLGALTIGSQTLRAALSNPVEKLRAE